MHESRKNTLGQVIGKPGEAGIPLVTGNKEGEIEKWFFWYKMDEVILSSWLLLTHETVLS